MATEQAGWRRCSVCKKPIEFGARHWVCSVSTCNRGRTALFFCSTSCWDAHLSIVPHRESYAVEKRAPSREEWAREQAAAEAKPPAAPSAAPSATAAREPRRIVPAPAAATPKRDGELPEDVLIVVSKLKAYVRARSGMNTSDAVVDPLSEAVRRLCDRAIEKARREGRKTVLDRDFE